MADNFPRVGSALLVRDEANKILLGKRNKDPQRGCWVLPGGKIHAFERIAEAATRELKEETGLDVEVEGHFGVYEIVNPPNEHRIVIYSWARVLGGVPKASDDLSALKFFSLDELGEVPMTPLVRKVLADAGFIMPPSITAVTGREQLPLIPLLLAGANERVRGRRGRNCRSRHRRGRPRVNNAPVLFDIPLNK